MTTRHDWHDPALSPEDTTRRLALINKIRSNPDVTITSAELGLIAGTEKGNTLSQWRRREADRFPKPRPAARPAGSKGRPAYGYRGGDVWDWLVGSDRFNPQTYQIRVPRSAPRGRGDEHKTPPSTTPGVIGRVLRYRLGLQAGAGNDYVLRSAAPEPGAQVGDGYGYTVYAGPRRITLYVSATREPGEVTDKILGVASALEADINRLAPYPVRIQGRPGESLLWFEPVDQAAELPGPVPAAA